MATVDAVERESQVSDDTEVLIAGAGPTGLVLALWLTHLGIKVRIIDKAASPGETSRALAVHARTLELYNQIGLADEVVAHSRKLEAARLWVRGRQRGRAVFGDMGVGISPYPFALVYPQDEHERLLIHRLEAVGVTVERPLELVTCEESGSGIVARAMRPDGSEETIAAAFLAGCDGARSKVREIVGGEFPGGTYSRLFYVADVEASGPVMNAELNLGLDRADFLAVFPMKGADRVRLVGDIERPDKTELTFADVGGEVIASLDMKIKRVNWFSTYRVHHRVAGRWRAGAMFLLGDAAHIHSPVGGQGMNTGIGDAINLAWKLAAVIKGQAAPGLLDTYEPERIAFARRLVASTDRAFQVISRDGGWARFVRLRLTPILMPIAFSLAAVRRLMFLTISQTNINYRDGALAEGGAGKIKGGDRLPWVREADNFAPLDGRGWRGQMFGEASDRLSSACAEAGLPLDRFAWTRAAERAGFAHGAFHLVRPDGYLSLVAQGAEAPAALAAYQARHGLRF
jgi:2-polyprenyl-6-methoxyphenol hydroxylase-like FAD-dependent oxidoreductase